jgi:hypothetical protein
VKVQTATLAGGSSNADRVFVTKNAVIVLDGATAFAPVDVDAGDYAATLGAHIANQLEAKPTADLSSVVAQAITATVQDLRLISARSAPSSTVSILRCRDRFADLYVLGDSPIHYGTGQTQQVLADNRIADLHLPGRDRYRARLAAGEGYTDRHRAILTGLQDSQRMYRNRPGGYWIAETDPVAAQHAHVIAVPTRRISWAVIATDGASDIIDHRRRPDWRVVSQFNSENLFELLRELECWETNVDPDGCDLPRAKRHDDKTLAACPELPLHILPS